MQRRGGRGRGGRKEKDHSKGRYWNRPQPREEQTERPRPPPHLRGKAIGLFYRDLNKNKPKTDHRSFTIGLTIPPRVIKQVQCQLQTIANIAKVQNIDLTFVSRFKKIKQELGVHIKTEPLELENKESHQDDFVPIKTEQKAEMKTPKEEENFVPLFKSSSSNKQPGTSKYCVKIEISSESEDDEEDPEPTFKKPWSENLSDIRKYVYKSFNKNPQSQVEHFVDNEDFISLNKEINTPTLDPNIIDLVKDESERKNIKEQSTFNSNLDAEMTVPKPLMMPEPLADPKPPKPDFASFKSELSMSKEQSTFNSNLDAEMTVPKPLMMPEPLADPKPPKPDFASFKSESNMSATPDFIPVKQDDLMYGSSGRQLSLRGGGDYKYGYKDIITGSFHDKLDECLAKGVSINITNSSDMKALNETLYEEYIEMLENHKYQKMLKFRETLPTFKKTEEVLNVINNNSVVVISGETGCGKSTQVPQILLDHAIMNRKGANTKIIVTQPRRIAASSLAERVAEERAERLGHSVGYAVRLEKVEPRTRGSIIYCTTGILLADLEVNQGLANITHVILDEVHERDTHVDLSMLVLKEILKKRKDLKVILMSATLNAPSLSAYFNNCPVLHIEGLAYPVKDVYLEEILDFTRYQFEDSPDRIMSAKQMEKEIKHRAEIGPWLESVKHTLDRDVYKTLLDPRSEELDKRFIVCLLQHLCRGEPGAILVFLPGIADITNLLKLMDESGAFPRRSHDIYPLHSKLPSLEQKQIFERPPNGVRKIIIATNIAETSITIDDIVYVIDCGRLKLSGLNVEENIVTLQTEWIAKANLMQRRGRAGRCQPGICYHLITTYRAERLDERLLPELQRSNLLEAVLMIKKLRLGKAEEALQMVPDPPAESTVQWAVKHLQQLGALDETETLTPLGWHLARLPVHPAAGKLLLLGALFGCLDRAASVAAVWGFKDPFMLVIGKEKEVDKAKRELTLDEPSDHVAISEAIMAWERAGHRQRTFAYNFFLSNSTLNLLSEMKRQFGDNLKQMGFLASADIRSGWENRNSANMSLFKAVVAAALYPNVANVDWRGLHSRNPRKNIHILARTPEEGRVEIHPSSVMGSMFNKSGFGDKPRLCNSAGANWLVYWLKQRSSKLFLIEVTCVYTLPLLFFGELRVEYDDKFPDDCLISISTVKVKCAKSTADLLFELRALLDHVLACKVMVSSDHSVRKSDFEEEVLNAVIQLITAEDEQADTVHDSFEDSDQSDYEPNRRRWRN